MTADYSEVQRSAVESQQRSVDRIVTQLLEPHLDASDSWGFLRAAAYAAARAGLALDRAEFVAGVAVLAIHLEDFASESDPASRLMFEHELAARVVVGLALRRSEWPESAPTSLEASR